MVAVRALANRPKLPLADDPTGQLDSLPVEREDVGVIASLMSNGSRLYGAVADGGGRPVSSVLLTSLDATAWSPTDIPFAASGISVRWNFATAGGVDVFLVDGRVHMHRD